MRRWICCTILGMMLTALALPPAHARGASAPVARASKLKFGGFDGYIVNDAGTEEAGSSAPVTPPPPARLPPAAKMPLCHEVTPVGVVVERASACSRTAR
jgi:hypothetical protein